MGPLCTQTLNFVKSKSEPDTGQVFGTVFFLTSRTCVGLVLRTNISQSSRTPMCCTQAQPIGTQFQIQHLKHHVCKATVAENVLVFTKVQVHGNGIPLLLASGFGTDICMFSIYILYICIYIYNTYIYIVNLYKYTHTYTCFLTV